MAIKCVTGVWCLVIDHNHGTDVWIFPTRVDAYNGLRRWVTQWWYDEMGGGSPPVDPEEMVDQYFNSVSESYCIITSSNMS